MCFMRGSGGGGGQQESSFALKPNLLIWGRGRGRLPRYLERGGAAPVGGGLSACSQPLSSLGHGEDPLQDPIAENGWHGDKPTQPRGIRRTELEGPGVINSRGVVGRIVTPKGYAPAPDCVVMFGRRDFNELRGSRLVRMGSDPTQDDRVLTRPRDESQTCRGVAGCQQRQRWGAHVSRPRTARIASRPEKPRAAENPFSLGEKRGRGCLYLGLGLQAPWTVRAGLNRF